MIHLALTIASALFLGWLALAAFGVVAGLGGKVLAINAESREVVSESAPVERRTAAEVVHSLRWVIAASAVFLVWVVALVG